MKKLLLLLLLAGIAYGQTRTSYLNLPQWTAGDTLRAGTANDPSINNFGLNNGFARLDSILAAAGLDSSGRFAHIYGNNPGFLEIDARYGVAVSTVQIKDSLDVDYNLNVDGSALIGGNMTVGGYIVVDSIQTNDDLSFFTDITFYDTVYVNSLLRTTVKAEFFDSIDVGTPSASAGVIRFSDGASGYARIYNSNGYSPSLALPNISSGTLATTNGDQDFTDMGNISADSLYVNGDVDINGYAIMDSLELGIPSAQAGVLRFSDGASGYARLYNSNGNAGNVEMPAEDGELLVDSRAGTVTVGAGDSVQVSFTGFTTSGVVIVSYVGQGAAYTKMPQVGYLRTNGFTIYADASYDVMYFIAKK